MSSTLYETNMLLLNRKGRHLSTNRSWPSHYKQMTTEMPLTITIVFPNGDTMESTMSANNTVADLKYDIYKNDGWASNCYYMMSEGVVLNEEKTLEYYDLDKCAVPTVHLHRCPRNRKLQAYWRYSPF